MPYDYSVSPTRPRQNLVDLFGEFADSPPKFLQYDNGYRGGQQGAVTGR